MKRRNEKKHVIDFLFPLAVFFVLAASSVAIVVLASGFYSRQVKVSSDSYSGRTALAYVTEKMHQNDENGAIADGTFDGENALVIRQRYDEKEVPGQSDGKIRHRRSGGRLGSDGTQDHCRYLRRLCGAWRRCVLRQGPDEG